MDAPTPLDLVTAHLREPVSTWSIGTFGVLAEFARDPNEPCEISGLTVVTRRGAIRAERVPEMRAHAYEALSARPGQWHHGVFFCLRRADAELPPRRAIAELGPDRQSIRPEDRGAILFDLGLGATTFAFCVRSADRALVGELRRAVGTKLLDAAHGVARTIVAASPHRVAIARLARIEVYQPIAPEDGRTPEGPHTHLIPSVLRPALTHSANIAMPAGWVPALTLYPAHPVQDHAGRLTPFANDAHRAFEVLMARYGDPEARDAKAAVRAAIARGEPPSRWRMPASRSARAASRIALRQLRQSGAEFPVLGAWERALERNPARRAA
ncbi:MAG TPA: hypothetical protein VKC64_10420 [Burkholderiales bacterium]|nr:hypothetical protein [Burkholderiales bacterium]